MCHKVQICCDIKRLDFLYLWKQTTVACKKSQGGMYEFKMSWRIRVTTLHSSKQNLDPSQSKRPRFHFHLFGCEDHTGEPCGSKLSEAKSHWKRSEHGLNINICFSTLRCVKFYVAVVSKDSPCFTLDELSVPPYFWCILQQINTKQSLS